MTVDARDSNSYTLLFGSVSPALQSVSQGTFPDSDEGTQWSIVRFPSALTADYYFRENYEKAYSAMLSDKENWIYRR